MRNRTANGRSGQLTVAASSFVSATFRFFAFFPDRASLAPFGESTSLDLCRDDDCSKSNSELHLLSLFEDGFDFVRDVGWWSNGGSTPRASGVRRENIFNRSGALRNRCEIFKWT